MTFEMENKKKVAVKPTQSFLRFSEIKDDCVIMDDGTLRAVLAVSSTNFDLKSQDEQNAIIVSFQSFLNSLDFSIQILMQSRKMDVTSYLEKLKKLASKQTNELLKVQTEEYAEFIRTLIENASIMNKSFYIVIPLGKSVNPTPAGFLSRLLGNAQAKEAAAKLENFKQLRQDLENRVTSIMTNLGGLGVKGVRLNTQELIRLLYNSYNFESAPLVDPEQLKDIKVLES